MDLSTVGSICTQSGGELRFYNHYDDSIHGEKFMNELRRNLTRNQGKLYK